MLEVKNISKSFYKHEALNDVSLHVNKGEVFGLLGPNGAGKTTLIRVINRIIQQDSGSVRFDGNLMTEKDLQSIGYLPEERGLYKNMTVEAHALFLGDNGSVRRSELPTFSCEPRHWVKCKAQSRERFFNSPPTLCRRKSDFQATESVLHPTQAGC